MIGKLTFVLVFGTSCVAFAQPASRSAVVSGKPYSADEKTEIARLNSASDGTRMVSAARVFRDSEGRVRREVTVPGTAGAKPQTRITISDPVAQVRYELNPETKTATRRTMESTQSRNDGRKEGEGHGPGHVEPPHGVEGQHRDGEHRDGEHREGEGKDAAHPEGGVRKHEDLGIQIVLGLSAHGSRNTVTEGGVSVIDESWFSPDLGVEIKSIHTDARTGQTTRTLANIQRGAPDASLFRVPPDYTLK